MRVEERLKTGRGMKEEESRAGLMREAGELRRKVETSRRVERRCQRRNINKSKEKGKGRDRRKKEWS